MGTENLNQLYKGLEPHLQRAHAEHTQDEKVRNCAQNRPERVMPIILSILTLAAPTMIACTVCDTATGTALRAGIFNDSFFITFLEVIAPFPVLGLVLFAINRYLPD